MLVKHTFPLDAEYEFTIGGGGPGGGAAGGHRRDASTARAHGAEHASFRSRSPPGPHTIGVAVLDRQRGAGVDDAYSDFRAANNGFAVAGGVQNVAIMGPFNADRHRRHAEPPAHLRLPAGDGRRGARLRARASSSRWRGAPTAARSRPRRSTHSSPSISRAARGDFETGMQQALARLLVAPRFLYRIEEEPAGRRAGERLRISDTELASRLSFFLWSSIPDEELLDLAAKGPAARTRRRCSSR